MKADEDDGKRHLSIRRRSTSSSLAAVQLAPRPTGRRMSLRRSDADSASTVVSANYRRIAPRPLVMRQFKRVKV